MSAAALATFTLPSLPHFDLPPLPSIEDLHLQKVAVTHASHPQRPRKAMSLVEDDENESYEKLEFVGDGIIRTSPLPPSTDLFPNLRPGPSTKLKSLLVNNITFAHLAKEYKLPDRLIAHPSQLITVRTQTSTLSALFEAHVAAVYLSTLKHGLTPHLPPSPPQSPGMARTISNPPASRGEAYEHVSNWLVDIFTPIATWALSELRKEESRLSRGESLDGGEEAGEEKKALQEDEVAKGAAMLLNQWAITHLGGMPTYEETGPMLGPHTCKCVLVSKDSKQLVGTAVRSTKKAARTVAAYHVAVQLKLME